MNIRIHFRLGLAALWLLSPVLAGASIPEDIPTVDEPPLPTGLPVEAHASPAQAIPILEKWTQDHPDDAEGWYGLSVCYISAGRQTDALSAMEKAVKLDFKERSAEGQTFKPTDYTRRAYNVMGLVKFGLKDLDGAADAFNQAIKINPAYGIAWNNLGLIQERQGKNDEAITTIKKAIELNPEYAVFWANLGQAYINEKNWKDANDAGQHAVSMAPTLVNGWLLLGESGTSLRNWEQVVESYHTAIDELDARHHSLLKADRDYVLALSEYGTACVNIGHLDDADKILAEALSIDPDRASALASLGLLRMKQLRWQESIPPLTKSVGLDPNWEGPWNNLGLAYLFGLHQPNDAIPAFQHALQLKPDYAEAWHGLGRANHDLKNNSEALDDFRKAVQFDPAHVDAWRQLALLTSDKEEADKAIAQAMALNPQDPATLNAQADISFTRQDWPVAEKAIHDALALSPDNATDWFLIGTVLFKEKKYSDAATADQTAIQKGANLTPKGLASCWNALGEVYMVQAPHLGTAESAAEWQLAADAFRHATDIDPARSESWFFLWACYHAMGRENDASTAQAKWTALGSVIPPSLHPPKTATASSAPPAAPPADDPISVAKAVNALLRDRKFDEALKMAQARTESHPDEALAWYSLGDVLMNEQHFADAIVPLTKANTLDPKMGPSWYDLGNCLAAQPGKADEAMQALIQSINLMPDFPKSWETLVRGYHVKKDLPGGEEQIQGLVNSHPESAYGWWALGELQSAQGKADTALTALQKAVDLKPDYAKGWNELGIAYGRLKQGDKAVDAFSHAVQAQPNYDEALNNLGYTYFQAGQTDKAIDAYKQALQANPVYKRALINLTQAYAQAAQWGPARDTCAQLAKIDSATATRLSQTFPVDPGAPVSGSVVPASSTTP